MKNNFSILALMLLVLCTITNCSKSDSSTPTSSSAVAPQNVASTPLKLNNLSIFNGKAPDSLVTDEIIGQAIRSIVPQAQFKCMSEIFNYMPDLALAGDGSLNATLSGSHADNWLKAYLSVNPSGVIDVVLRCPAEQQQIDDAPFLYFTNRKLTDTTPKSVKDWFYVVGRDSDLIKISDGQTSSDIQFSDFMKDMLATAANPKSSTHVTQSELGTIVGSWSCQDRNPDGTTTPSSFIFKSDSTFSARAVSVFMSGTYEQDAKEVSLQVKQINNGSITLSANDAFMDLSVDRLTSSELTFVSTLRRSGGKRTHTCKSDIERESLTAPHPKHDMPAAINSPNNGVREVLQQHDDMQKYNKSLKCQALERAAESNNLLQYKLEEEGCM